MNNLTCPFCGGNQVAQINETQCQCMHCGKNFMPVATYQQQGQQQLYQQQGYQQVPSMTPPPIPGQPFGQNASKIPVVTYVMMGVAAFIAVFSISKHHNDAMEMMLMLCHWVMGGAFAYIMFMLRKQTSISFVQINSTLNSCYTTVAVSYGIIAFISGLFAGDIIDDKDTSDVFQIIQMTTYLVFAITAFVIYGNYANKVSPSVKSWLTSLLPLAVLMLVQSIISMIFGFELCEDWDYENVEKLVKFYSKWCPLLSAVVICYFGRTSITLDEAKQ